MSNSYRCCQLWLSNGAVCMEKTSWWSVFMVNLNVNKLQSLILFQLQMLDLVPPQQLLLFSSIILRTVLYRLLNLYPFNILVWCCTFMYHLVTVFVWSSISLNYNQINIVHALNMRLGKLFELLIDLQAFTSFIYERHGKNCCLLLVLLQPLIIQQMYVLYRHDHMHNVLCSNLQPILVLRQFLGVSRRVVWPIRSKSNLRSLLIMGIGSFL